MILVAKDSGKKADLLFSEVVLYARDRRGYPLRIVRTVDYEERVALRELLESALPLGIGHSLPECRIGNVKSLTPEHVDHAYRRRRIAGLVKSEQSELYPFTRIFKPGTRKIARGDPDLFSVNREKIASASLCGILYDLKSLVRLAAEYHRHPGLYYPRLFARDRRDRVAEYCRMVKRNSGYHRDKRGFYYIRRVEPTAHTDLEHDRIALVPCKEKHSHSRYKLEFGGLVLHLFGKRLHV